MERLNDLMRLLSRPAGRAVFFAVLAVSASWPYLSTAGALNDFRDAHFLAQHEEVARKTVVEFGQLPLWNPYYCGGMYGLGTPQSRFASPMLLLSVVFGTWRGEAIAQLLLLLIGLEGAFRYLRARGVKASSATLAAPIFRLSGVFALAPFLGWSNFYSFQLLPWVLVAVRRGLRGNRASLAVAAFAAPTMVGFGGTYAAPIAGVVGLFEVVEALVASRRRFDVLQRALTIGVLAIGASAFRLWPVFETLQRAPRIVGGTSGPSLKEVTGLVWGAWPPGSASGTWYLLGVPATAVAAISAWRKRNRSLVVFVIACVWLAIGYTVSPSLFGVLRSLPVFSMLRSPERFLIPTSLLVAALAGKALDLLWAARRRRPRLRLVFALAVVALMVNVFILSRNFELGAQDRTMLPLPSVAKREFHQARGNRWAAAYYAPMSRGSLSCMEAYPVPESPRLRGDLQHEAYLQDESAGTLTERAWSPNAISASVTLSRPTRLLINQNHHTGWRSSVGRVISEGGLLGVELPAGTHDVSLTFLPVSAVGGALISLAAIALAWWFWRRHLSWNVMTLLSFSCAVPGGLAVALLQEPLFERDKPLAPDGQPLFVERPFPGTEAAAVRFEGDVRLAATRVTPNEADQTVTFELDFLTGAKPNPTLGVFVHIQPTGADRFGADHALLSEAVSFADAPPNTLVRDVFTVVVAPEQRTRSWEVWAGLWAFAATVRE